MILVTGATGILGRVIVLKLLEKGLSVRATKRPCSNLDDVRESFSYYVEDENLSKKYFNEIQWIDLDFSDLDLISEALEGVREVYHCTGMVNFNSKDFNEIYNVNSIFTKNLLYACENSSVEKFCFISSIAVLDKLNESGELDESSDYDVNLNHSYYAKSKYLAEMEVWRASAEGLKVVIVNPGVILGSGNWNGSSGRIFDFFSRNRYTFSGSTSYVDVRDVARISINLMDRNIFSERFVVVSENFTYKEFSQIIRNKLNLSNPKVIPNYLLNFVKIFRFLSFIFPKFRLLNKSNIETVTSNNKVSNKKVKNILDYEFISVNDSIDFHLENYLKHKTLKNS